MPELRVNINLTGRMCLLINGSQGAPLALRSLRTSRSTGRFMPDNRMLAHPLSGKIAYQLGIMFFINYTERIL